MKTLRPAFLPAFALITGSVGLALRLWLLSTADAKGFLAQNHISAILLWILVTLTLAVFFIFVRQLVKAPKYAFNFPPSLPGGIGVCLGAVGIGSASVMELLSLSGGLSGLSALLGLACVPVLVYVGICRIQGKRFTIAFHGFACLYLIFHLIALYQSCSADPQLQGYCFQVLAQICLLLTLYYRACFDAGEGSRKCYTYFQMATVFFSLIALPGSENWVFYIGTVLWMLTNLCNLQPFCPEQEEHPC